MSQKASKNINAFQSTLRPAAGAASPLRSGTWPRPEISDMPLADTNKMTKTEILSELREEISTMFKKKRHAALGKNLLSIKSEIQALKC